MIRLGLYKQSSLGGYWELTNSVAQMRADPHKKKKNKEVLGNLNLPMTTKITSQNVRNINHRVAITKLRLSNH